LIQKDVYVLETCTRCPEYREEYFIPFVSSGGRECRFFWEWHREVEENIRRDQESGEIRWPQAPAPPDGERFSEYASPREEEEHVGNDPTREFAAEDEAHDGDGALGGLISGSGDASDDRDPREAPEEDEPDNARDEVREED
jgi:hypothetical protein